MRNKWLLGILSAALVAAGACSDAADQEPVVEGTRVEAEDLPAPVCTLTGRSIPKKVDVERPAVAVKIENSPAARPQSGLERADLVFEEIVEGGITRFMAIYHCGSSAKAGPVRSARFDDPKIAIPFTRILAYSGANSIVESELNARGIVALDEDTAGDALFRDPPGSFDVHSLFADTDALRKLKPRLKPPTDKILSFGAIAGKSSKARSVTMNFTSSNPIEYRWKGGAWKRFEAGTAFLTAAGGQIAVPNVLVQEVDVNHSDKIRDVAGNPSPDIELVGVGRAFLFRDGRVVKGQWEISKEGGRPRYTTKKGDRLTFAEGPIWIELVPSDDGEVKGTFSYK